MSTSSRLEKIAGRLTPKQAVLAWLAEAQSFGSLQTYVESLQGASDASFPLVRFQDQIEQAHGVTGRRMLKPEERHAVRLDIRDGGFLFFLCANLNWRFAEWRRADCLEVALVATMFRLAAVDDHEHTLVAAWEQAREALSTAYTEQAVVATLGRSYFGGASPLFPDVAEELAQRAAAVEKLVEGFNQAFRMLAEPPQRRSRSPQVAPPLDPRLVPMEFAEVRASVAEAVDAEVSLQVDMARAEAWDLIGKRDEGIPLVARHVWSS